MFYSIFSRASNVFLHNDVQFLVKLFELSLFSMILIDGINLLTFVQNNSHCLIK